VRRLAVSLLFFAAARLFALEVPPKPQQWVNDYGANLLSALETEQLNSRIEQLRAYTGAHMLVMIWPSLEGEDAIGFTRRVAKMWKVNDDRALMLFVFVEDRKTFIQVGRGLKPVISDAFAADIYRNTLVPRFRQRQFYAGIAIAIDRLAAALESAPAPAVVVPPPAIQAVQTPPARRTSDWQFADFVGIFVGLGTLGLIALVIYSLLRRGGSVSGDGNVAKPRLMFDAAPPAESHYVVTPTPGFVSGGADSVSAGGSWGGGADSVNVGGSWGGGDSSFDGGGAGGNW
jgi:uncharacterized protein